jgi:membrane fusion protein (multidrug efflux system)
MTESAPKNTIVKTASAWLGRNPGRKIIFLSATIILAVVLIIPRRNRDVTPAEAPAVNVATIMVSSESEYADTLDLPGVIEPNLVVEISAEVAGRVESIPLKKGAAVSAGDLLIRLNDELLKPEYESAQAQFKRDQIEYERVLNLVKEKVLTQRDLDNATSQAAMSKARLDEVGARLRRTAILAPCGGHLNNVHVEEGEYVQVSMPLAEIVNTEKVKAAVEVPERDISYLEAGGKAQVFSEIRGLEKAVEGTITFISKTADQQTRSTRIEITLDNNDGLFVSGQIVRVILTRQVLHDVIFIPLLAVIPMENSKAVYIVNSTRAQRREVELGVIKGELIQVKRGLNPGDHVIVAGHRFISPGQDVNVTGEKK